jgi:hypothetical protein
MILSNPSSDVTFGAAVFRVRETLGVPAYSTRLPQNQNEVFFLISG